MSVGVAPCHLACKSGGNTCDQLPGVLTRIIKAMVMPLNTSKESSRCGFNASVKFENDWLPEYT